MDTITEAALDTIIATKARDMYRAEFLAMAIELKALRTRLNKRADIIAMGPSGDFADEGTAARWANGVRARMHALKPGDAVIIPDIARLVRYYITARDW